MAGGEHDRPREHVTNNQNYGVQVALSNGTRITQNAIDDTGGAGIDLVGGANNNQTAPSLTSATGSGANIQVQGTLASAASTAFRLEFFRSQSCSNGAGEAFLGATTQSTDGSGNLSFNLAVPASGNGQIITATATDPAGNTSEFSTCTPHVGRGGVDLHRQHAGRLERRLMHRWRSAACATRSSRQTQPGGSRQDRVRHRAGRASGRSRRRASCRASPTRSRSTARRSPGRLRTRPGSRSTA